MTIFELPDGRRFDVPDSVDPQAALTGLRAKFGTPQSDQGVSQAAPQQRKLAPPLKTEKLSLAERIASSLSKSTEGMFITPEESSARLQGLASGATFGFSPEIAGTLGAPFSDKPREQIIAEQRERENLAQEQFPSEFQVGEITSLVGTGLGGASTKIGAKIAANIGRSGLLGKVLKTAGIGGLSGALSGAGASPEDRLTGAIGGGAIGGGVTAGLPIGGALAGGVLTKAKNIINRFIGGDEVAEAIAAGKIPTTVGQRGQDVTQQAFEESALKGTKGEQAKEIISKFREKQNLAIRSRVEQLRSGTEVTAQDAITGAVDIVDAENKILRQQVDNAYQLAREQGDASLKAFDVNTMLLDSVNNTAETFNLKLAPRASAKLDDLAALAKPAADFNVITGRSVKPIDFKKMENWRSEVSTLQSEASRKGDLSDAKLLGSMREQFDDFIETTLERGMIQGDEAVITGIRNARGLRREVGKRFESNEIVKKILRNPDFTPEQVTGMIIGSGKFSGKKESANTVKALISAAGDKAPEVKAQLKNAVLARMISKSKTKEILTQAGEDIPVISPAKLKTSLDDLFEENSSLLKEVLDKKEISSLSGLRRELGRITSIKPGGFNASGSGAVIVRGLRDTFRNIPLVGDIVKGLGDTSSAAEAMRAISQIDGILTPEITGKAFLLSGTVLGEQAGEKALTNE